MNTNKHIYSKCFEEFNKIKEYYFFERSTMGGSAKISIYKLCTEIMDEVSNLFHQELIKIKKISPKFLDYDADNEILKVSIHTSAIFYKRIINHGRIHFDSSIPFNIELNIAEETVTNMRVNGKVELFMSIDKFRNEDSSWDSRNEIYINKAILHDKILDREYIFEPNLKIGDIYKVVIIKCDDLKAFVRIWFPGTKKPYWDSRKNMFDEGGISGYIFKPELHISMERKTVSDVVTEGEILNARLIQIIEDDHLLSFSLKK